MFANSSEEILALYSHNHNVLTQAENEQIPYLGSELPNAKIGSEQLQMVSRPIWIIKSEYSNTDLSIIVIGSFQ